jgi:hypothetical protein
MDDDDTVNSDGDGANASSAAGEPSEKWQSDLDRAKKREKRWRKRGADILSRYRQERKTDNEPLTLLDKTFNILWSNTEVLMAHLCTDLGTPDVRRQFPKPGRNTQVARLAAEVLEKAMIVEAHAHDEVAEIEHAIEDMLLPGRGVLWVDLEEVEAVADDDADEETAEDAKESELKDATLQTRLCHVGWDDYLEGAAKREDQVPWKARRHLFNADDLRESFPEYADEIPRGCMGDMVQAHARTHLRSRGLPQDIASHARPLQTARFFPVHPSTIRCPHDGDAHPGGAIYAV